MLVPGSYKTSKILPFSFLSLCFRGCSHMGSMLHIWWECPGIRGFWNNIFNIIQKVTGLQVPSNSSTERSYRKKNL